MPVDSAVAEPLGPDDPREIGQFTVLGLLGSGGMAEVYLGTRDGRYVAVKRVRPRLVSSERFVREVAILHRVPLGVAPSVLASDSTAPEPWFATEYVPGLTVDDAVRSSGPLPRAALWLLLAETAAHLQAVHAAEIVHRDLKPANIMLVRDGVKLIDFGIALAGDQSRLTRHGASSGTRGFVAPEQDAGSRDAAAPADVYSLAATLVYAASAVLPGSVPDVGPLRAVDADLAELVEACLSADPGLRPSAADLAASAREHIGGSAPSWPPEVMDRIAVRRSFAATPVEKMETVLPPEPGPTKPPSDAPSVPRRRRFVVPVAGVAALCGLVAVAVALLPTSSGHGSAAPGRTATSGGMVDMTGARVTPAGLATSATPTAQANPPTAPGPATQSGVPTASTTSGPGPLTTKAGATSPAVPVNGSSTASPGPPSIPGPSTRPDTSQSSSPPKPVPSPTSSSIPGIDSADDPARVPGSEADARWVANDATCSAWLDTDGAGGLAAVVNTSFYQSCVAELSRSDGMQYTFSQSHGAKKTNFIPDAGYTMRICVWPADDQTDRHCSPSFEMNGNTPVAR